MAAYSPILIDHEDDPYPQVCSHNKDKCGCYAALQEEKSMLEYRLGKFQEKQQRFLEQIRQTIVEATILPQEELIHELTSIDATIEKFMIEANSSTPQKPKQNTGNHTTTTTPTTPTTNTPRASSTSSSSTSSSPSTPSTTSTTTTFTAPTTSTTTTTTTSIHTQAEQEEDDPPLIKKTKILDNQTVDNKPKSNNNNSNYPANKTAIKEEGNQKIFENKPSNIRTSGSYNNESTLSREELAAILKEDEEDLKKENDKRAEDDFKIALSFQPRQCPMCLDDVEVDFISVLTSCSHEYCRECLIHYVTDKITSKSFPINCPLPSCKKEISVYDFEILLDAKMMEKYNEFVFSSTIEANPETYSCCPTADCGYVFLYEKGDSSDFNCPKCNKRYCLTCRADFHTGSTCEQYQQWQKENGQADQLFEQFAQGMKLKKCPKCNRWTEKISGCNHMSCKCGQKFCYHCGNSYPCACGQDPHVGMMQPQVRAAPMANMFGQPFGAQPFGAQPFGAQPFGAQPFGAQPFGAQPMFQPYNPNNPPFVPPNMANNHNPPPAVRRVSKRKRR